MLPNLLKELLQFNYEDPLFWNLLDLGGITKQFGPDWYKCWHTSPFSKHLASLQTFLCKMNGFAQLITYQFNVLVFYLYTYWLLLTKTS